jgi:hypothetical protein
MRIKLGDLRNLIREEIKSGSHPEEDYSEELLSDPKFKEKSVYVRDSAKKKILSWAKDMKLSTK